MKCKYLILVSVVFLIYLIVPSVSATMVSYNYTNESNIWASKCQLTVSGIPDPPPPNSKPPGCFPYEIDITSQTTLHSSDNSREIVVTSVDDTAYSHAIFNASIQEDIGSIKNITWTFEGNEQGNGIIYLYLYNYTSSSYVQFSTITGSVDITRYLSTTSASDFIDSSTKEIYLVAHYSGIGKPEYFYVDYVTLDIEYDGTNPSISISSPTNNANTTDNTLDVNYTVSDDYDVDSCWYSNDSMSTNTTLSSCNNLTDVVWSDGQHNVTIWVNDTAGNENSSSITFTIDTTPPSLLIVYPIQDASYTTNTIDLNYTVSDEIMGLDTCWYQNDSGANITISCGTNTTITQGSDGSYTVYMWANDTLGNVASDEIDYVISTTSPSLTLIYPTNNKWFQSGTNLYFNYTSMDDNGIDTCQLWGNWTGVWHLNQTNIHGGDTSVDASEGNFSVTIPEGNGHIWNVWCNDTNGDESWGLANWTFNIDETIPLINLIYPTNTNYTSTSLSINYTSSDINRDSCWYTNDSGVTNHTMAGCNNVSYTASEGSNTIIIYVNDSANNQNSSTVTFFVDAIIPNVTITAPFSSGDYLNYNTSIQINATITDTNLDTCWYQDNTDPIVTFTCGNNLSLNLTEGVHTITVYANDSLNNIGSDLIVFTTDVTLPTINDLSVGTSGGSQTFSFDVNITDTNINNCWYTVYNSTGGVDGATIENTSVSCVSSGNSETCSSFGNFVIKVWGNDSAGNQNSSNESFTLTSITPQTGGSNSGEPVIVYGENSTWSMQTDVRGNSYDFYMSQGSKREKTIIFKNLGGNKTIINISCEDITGRLCQYVTISNTTIELPASENILTTISFSLNLPPMLEDGTKQLENGIYDFSIKATAPIDKSTGKISVRARVGEYGIWGWLVGKLTGKTTIFDIEFYNFFLLLLPFIILAPLFYFLIFASLKIKFPLTFLITVLVSFIMLFFLNGT